MLTISEIKSSLRDWMTATCQMVKVSRQNSDKLSTSDISYLFRKTFGIRMNDKWVEKALYGKKRDLGRT
jgi:hypothetical protein